MNNKRKIYQLIYVLVLFAFSVAFTVFIFPSENQFEYSYTKGAKWLYDDLKAPFDFPIYRTETEIRSEKDSIVASFIPYYVVDTTISKSFMNSYSGFLSKLIEEKYSDVDNINVFANIEISQFSNKFQDRLASIYNRGIIAVHEFDYPTNYGDKINYIRSNNVSELEFNYDFYTVETAKAEVLNFYYSNKYLSTIDSLSGFYIKKMILKTDFEPNIKYDNELNSRYLSELINKISPTSGLVEKGQLIISKGMLVSEQDEKVLNSLKMEYDTSSTTTSFWLVQLGVTIIMIILYAAIFMYMWIFNKKKAFDFKLNTFFVAQMILLYVAVYFVFYYGDFSINVVPFVLISLLLLTFMEFHISFLIYFITIFILSFFAANRFEFIFIQTITGLIGMYSLKNTSKRQQIFLSMLIVFFTYALLHTGFSLIRLGRITSEELREFMNYGISSLLLLLYLPFVYIYEKVFGFLSGFTLMELSDTNNPALRILSEKAPGTFQHSVQLSNIVESVVRELGGNSLLARTGALYHDIGKTYAPEYFIENQNGVNIHSSLTYEDSAKRIIAHVSEGIELAKKYNLPIQVMDFIEQHHGTSVTRYFYNSWQNANPDKEPDITMFQYPGPKPQTLELIVMMMADAVEAASRTLKVYSQESIEKLVNGIVDAQFRDGQYDDVEITMKQIGKAKRILISKIENIYHSRIAYPELTNK